MRWNMKQFLLFILLLFPLMIVKADDLNLKAQSAILIDQKTGEVLYKLNENERRPMASMTKIMSLLLIMEKIDDGTLKYDDEVIEHIEREIENDALEEAEENRKNKFSDRDEYFIPAVELILETGQASVAMFQRKFKMGYQRAARLIDQLEEYKIIGEYEGTKPRQVLITKQQFSEMLMNSGE